ncbi:MAG: rod shape-determining protein RodA [Rikenellaceae bacterium]|jgi:rod shape determining protein RodA|nr:rod shape-determining protein RodA [Rikenellaceae bacterium]
MIGANRHRIAPAGEDWGTVLIYLLLILIGWISIYAAVYDEAHASIFDLSQSYGKQLIWIGISLFIGISVLLIDDKYWHILAQPLYWLSIIVLLGTAFLGRDIKGATAWYEIGGISIQPVEFVKITTSLVLARVMSSYSFNIHQPRSVFTVFLLIGLPMAIIVGLQNDTGSALVFGSFFFMLYREGFSGWFYVVGFLFVALFLLSFYVEPLTLLILLIVGGTFAEALMNGRWKSSLIYLSGIALTALALYFGLRLGGIALSAYLCLLIAVALSLVFIVLYAYRNRLKNVYLILILFAGSLAFTQTVDYAFENILQSHQKERVLDFLGLKEDLLGVGYNANQSQLAIGSGAFLGKGFLQGTQTKYDFVPEQSTDFIFCTIGEEWGFVGCTVVIALYVALILRLIAMGERQQEAFGRIYCYCAAGIFLFHILINIGMTIGLMPVIGIPLPFVSYGGSSMIAFTLLLFIALRLDSAKKTHITRI